VRRRSARRSPGPGVSVPGPLRWLGQRPAAGTRTGTAGVRAVRGEGRTVAARRCRRQEPSLRTGAVGSAGATGGHPGSSAAVGRRSRHRAVTVTVPRPSGWSRCAGGGKAVDAPTRVVAGGRRWRTAGAPDPACGTGAPERRPADAQPRFSRFSSSAAADQIARRADGAERVGHDVAEAHRDQDAQHDHRDGDMLDWPRPAWTPPGRRCLTRDDQPRRDVDQNADAAEEGARPERPARAPSVLGGPADRRADAGQVASLRGGPARTGR
jgi:hypothetical protein